MKAQKDSTHFRLLSFQFTALEGDGKVLHFAGPIRVVVTDYLEGVHHIRSQLKAQSETIRKASNKSPSHELP